MWPRHRPRRQIVDALNSAIAKVKIQFPNLTNDTDAVLDVITGRLSQAPDTVLQGLRLPYVKLPRELKR